MLAEDRRRQILAWLDRKKSVSVMELTELLQASEATVRRDLTALEKLGYLNKVHGGATALHHQYVIEENELTQRYGMQADEKRKIGQYAATLIKDKDFVYIDAGTSTEAMIDFIFAQDVTFITNGLSIAQHLAQKGWKVFVSGGRLKSITGALIGGEAIDSLRKFNFTVGFFGTNGIDVTSGYSTPDIEEARMKTEAMKRCDQAYILADSSKFNVVSSVSFADLSKAEIITTTLFDQRYQQYTKIKEVGAVDLHSDI